MYAYVDHFEVSKMTLQNVRELEEFRMIIFHMQRSKMPKMET